MGREITPPVGREVREKMGITCRERGGRKMTPPVGREVGEK